jgi:hypothetical protein
VRASVYPYRDGVVESWPNTPHFRRIKRIKSHIEFDVHLHKVAVVQGVHSDHLLVKRRFGREFTEPHAPMERVVVDRLNGQTGARLAHETRQRIH